MPTHMAKCSRCGANFEPASFKTLDFKNPLCDRCNPNVKLVFGKRVGWWVWALAVGCILGLVVFRFAESFQSSEPTEAELSEDAGEATAHFMQSIEAGKKAGDEDCENHRHEGATWNPAGWDDEAYRRGYEDGYNDCLYSRKAYEQGKKDGAADCFDGWKRYRGDAWMNNSFHYDGSGYYDDYERGYNEGYGPVDCYEPEP